MKNKELIQLLEIEKSLVYFSSSLKSNEVTLEKIMRGRFIKMYEEDQDLLEDVLVEIKQAIEMANIYLNILSGTMDAFASVISNNLNIVMKVLASITLIISIPTVISGLYGMNVDGLPLSQFWWFPFVLSLVCMLIAGDVYKRQGIAMDKKKARSERKWQDTPYQGRRSTVRKSARRRKIRLWLLYFLMTVCILCIGIALSLTVLFKIDTIEVVGETRYDTDQIIALSGIEKGQNLFLCKTCLLYTSRCV